MAGSIEQILSNQDYYEIRLESIGGLGANLCGKMVGRACSAISGSQQRRFFELRFRVDGDSGKGAYPFLSGGEGDPGAFPCCGA